MYRVPILQRPFEGGRTARFVWLTAGLFAIALTIIFLAILWTSDPEHRLRLLPFVIYGFCVALAGLGFLAASMRSLAVDLARTQARAQELAGRDPLSNLPNRLLF